MNKPNENEYNLERLNFLIVDDNRHMRSLVKSILGAIGVRNSREAGDGADAFKELRHFEADIIICDWLMDPLDGVEFVRMVRTADDSPNPFVPVIMLTGHTEMHRVEEARDAGVNEFLAKPISAKKLFSRIQSVIDVPRKFIRTKGMFAYFGPDRRRKDNPNYTGPDRRDDGAKTDGAGPGAGDDLSQSEVEALLNS